MKKSFLLVIFVVAVIIVASVFAYFIFINSNGKNQVKDLSLVNDEKVIETLKTNSDIVEYIKKYNDYKIKSKEILTKESIIAGQKADNFQPVYVGLDLEDNRYIKVELMDQAGSNGFISVIDFKNNSVPKAFGILLFQASAETIKNGQIPSPTENK